MSISSSIRLGSLLTLIFAFSAHIGAAQSPDETTVPPAASITDHDGDVWTLSGTKIFKNGADTTVQAEALVYWHEHVYCKGVGQQRWYWHRVPAEGSDGPNEWLWHGSMKPGPLPPVPTGAFDGKGVIEFVGSFAPTGVPLKWNVDKDAGNNFGKHTQWDYDPVRKVLVMSGGDGYWPWDPGNPMKVGGSVNYYDAVKHTLTQAYTPATLHAGDVLPEYNDGCTWTYNSKEKTFWSVPGYLQGKTTAWPADGATPVMNHAMTFDPASGRWTDKCPVPDPCAQWGCEVWGGCYDSKRNRIVMQHRDMMYFLDCATGTFSQIEYKTPEGIRNGQSGTYVQYYDPVKDEVLSYNCRNGAIIGWNAQTGAGRIIARVPETFDNPEPDIKGYNKLEMEPAETIECGIAFDRNRRKLVMFYQWNVIRPSIWVVDIETGKSTGCEYPSEMFKLGGGACNLNQACWDPGTDEIVATGCQIRTIGGQFWHFKLK